MLVTQSDTSNQPLGLQMQAVVMQSLGAVSVPKVSACSHWSEQSPLSPATAQILSAVQKYQCYELDVSSSVLMNKLWSEVRRS